MKVVRATATDLNIGTGFLVRFVAAVNRLAGRLFNQRNKLALAVTAAKA